MIVTHVLVLEASSAYKGSGLDSTAAWKELVKALATGTGRAAYTGCEQEDPSKYWLLSDWPTIEAWSQNSDVQRAIQTLSDDNMAHSSSSYSVAIQSEDRRALEAATTEISIGFVQPGSDSAIRLAQATTIYTQNAAVTEIPGGAVGTVSGWTYDKDVAFTTNDGKQSRARGYVSLLGWTSKEAYLAFPESEIGTDDILSAGAEGWWMGHVNFSKTLP